MLQDKFDHYTSVIDDLKPTKTLDFSGMRDLKGMLGAYADRFTGEDKTLMNQRFEIHKDQPYRDLYIPGAFLPGDKI